MEMTEELAKHGLFFDYLYNLRVLEPNIAGDTSDLKEKSGEYTESKQFSDMNSVLMRVDWFYRLF